MTFSVRTALVLLAIGLFAPGCTIVREQERRVDPAASHALPPITIPAEREGAAYERCLVFGDTGTGGPGQRAVAHALAERARRTRPAFAILLGDNFYMEGVRSLEDPLWRGAFEDVYSAQSLAIPYFACLGNHDWKGSVEAELHYHEKNPLWNLPAHDYQFTRTLADGTTIEFFAIDTTPIHDGKDESAQLARLDAALAASTARWKIVFGHHPLYANGGSGSDPALIAALEPIFTRRNVDLYLCGHVHALEALKPIAGVRYVVSGAGGGIDNAGKSVWAPTSAYAATNGGFVELRLGHDEIVIEFVRLDSETQFATSLTKPG